MTTTTVEELFQQGLDRYSAGEAPQVLIPVFKEVCDRAQRNSPALTCLAWLYLLDGKPALALKAAQKAVKLNPQDPQARINLVMAMLDTAQKGVRPHIEIIQQLLMVPELREEVDKSFADGLERNPEWASLLKVKAWLDS
ncbi:tetratricopeptide repeat protein [Altericista sp. CCNU0014]|uniref:tetratricopeptide repeat protein n=1 Tax=Altericista sp. CCNU0014 TaxID=3082949 RepID=UPI00384FAF38